MKRLLSAVVILMCVVAFTVARAQARDQIQVAGSSTVLPYAKIVAEIFGEVYPNFKIPVIESGGSGAGIKEFCRSVGDNTIDVANASRAMKSSELQSCMDAGVVDVEEVRIGYDGIVFAINISGPNWALNPIDVYKALAAKLIIDNKLVDNKIGNWQEINTSFPKWDIAVYIPGEKHGTREVFEEKLMLEGCKESGAFAAMKASGLDDKAANANCVAVRKDGKAIDIDGDYSETFARVLANKTGVGVFGLAFYDNNTDRLKAATIHGVLPSVATIANGKYSVSRPLFFYVKKAHLGVIPGLKEYIEFFLDDQMIGPDGPLADYGLVAAPENEREAQRSAFQSGAIMVMKK